MMPKQQVVDPRERAVEVDLPIFPASESRGVFPSNEVPDFVRISDEKAQDFLIPSSE